MDKAKWLGSAFTKSLDRLGIAPHFIRQSLTYRSGHYTAQIKEAMAQRSFFIALYQLVCGRETGARIPTLLLSPGKEKVNMLLASS